MQKGDTSLKLLRAGSLLAIEDPKQRDPSVEDIRGKYEKVYRSKMD